jgi:hypothetical protein
MSLAAVPPQKNIITGFPTNGKAILGGEGDQSIET